MHDGNALIGVLRTGTFFFRHAEPGTHTYRAQAGASDSIAVEVVEGATSYIECDVRPRVGHPPMRSMPAKRAQPAIVKLRWALP